MQRLSATLQPEAGSKDFMKGLGPDRLKMVTTFVEPSLAAARADNRFQFEQRGYFVTDGVDRRRLGGRHLI